MSIQEDGGPAFAFASSRRFHEGMSLRDYFAAKAMQGMLANGDWVNRMSDNTGVDPAICVAAAAFEVADAMLLERAQ